MSWEVNVQQGRRDILLNGPEGRFRPEVFRGVIGHDLFRAFRALEAPVMADGIHAKWTVSVPYQFQAFENRQARRFLVLRSDDGKELVLDFRRDQVPRSLVRDLGVIFGDDRARQDADAPEGETDEGHHGKLQADAGSPGRARKGFDPGRGLSASR